MQEEAYRRGDGEDQRAEMTAGFLLLLSLKVSLVLDQSKGPIQGVLPSNRFYRLNL